MPIPARAESAIVATLRAGGCIFARDEARLIIDAARTPADLDAMVDRRVAGVPLEQVVGWARFCGLRIAVHPGVFVPRRRTEFLVRQAVALGAGRPGIVVVDLCCGTGAIGTALASALPGIELHSADIDAEAVRCARLNVPTASHVYQGDLYDALPETLRGRVAILAANVPYVPSAELPLMPAEAREHEPPAALDGGADGLEVLRRVAGDAPRWLAPGGSLLIEISERQAALAEGIFERAGLIARLAASEDLGATVVAGTRR